MEHLLITDEQLVQLISNGARTAAGDDIDFYPVIKLFTPDANATWLLTEADPDDPDRLFGLCDLGLGYAELGYVSLAEIQSIRGPLGLVVESDRYFRAAHPISWYVIISRHAGRIVTT